MHRVTRRIMDFSSNENRSLARGFRSVCGYTSDSVRLPFVQTYPSYRPVPKPSEELLGTTTTTGKGRVVQRTVSLWPCQFCCGKFTFGELGVCGTPNEKPVPTRNRL